MKRKILGIVFALAIIVTILPLTTAPIAQAAPSGTTLAAVYKAYYDVLKAAVDTYGIGAQPDPNTLEDDVVFEQWIKKMESGVYAGQGVFRAELIYLGDSALPQLLYVYDTANGPSRYVCSAEVYGYSTGAELLYAGIIGGDSDEIAACVVTDRNGVSYIHDGYYGGNYVDENVYFPEVKNYYTIRNGQWLEVPASEIDISSTRQLEYSPDTVSAVLAQLHSLQSTPPSTPQDATPSAWSLNVNGGTLRGTDMYSISGNNYLKIRDIAALLNGTVKQFNISVEDRTVNLISGAAYDARGDEMTPNPNAVKTKTSETTFSFTLDGKPIELTAYMIAGSNYIRIRDILRLFDVFVGYNSSLREFYIDTTKAYEDN
jgi:hypothetical protein